MKMIIKSTESKAHPLMTSPKKKISSLTSGNLTDELYVADVLGIDGTSSKLMLSLAYEKGYTIKPDGSIEGKKKTLSSLSSGNFVDDIELYLALGLDMNDADSISAIMRSIAFGKEYKGEGNKADFDYEIIVNTATGKNEIKMIGDKSPKSISALNGNFVNDLELGEIIEITPSSPPILIALQDTAISNLSSKIGTLTLKDILGEEQCESNKLLGTMASWKIDEFGTNVNSLKLGQIIDTEATGTPKLLQSLSGTKINELGTAVSDLTLNDMMENVGDNFILKHLKDSTLSTLPEDISNLTIEDVFADDIYDEHGNMKGTWKYLLDDDISNEGTPKKHKLSEMTSLISNMTSNIQKATLNELSSDGIVSGLDPAVLSTPLGIYASKYGVSTIGELTVPELLSFVGVLLNIVNSFPIL